MSICPNGPGRTRAANTGTRWHQMATMAAASHLVRLEAPVPIALRAFSRQSAITCLRHHPDGQGRAQRHDDKVIQETEDRYEVRNQVDRADGVDHHSGGQQLRAPGCPGVPAGQVQGIGVCLEALCPALPPLPKARRPACLDWSLLPGGLLPLSHDFAMLG